MSENLNISESFEIHEGYACFRPHGTYSVSGAGDEVAKGIGLAYEHQLRNLFVDTTRLTGFPPPTYAERYFMVHAWATQARGIVRVAVLARPEIVDPQRFGILASFNAGLTADVFTSEAEALNWLLRETPR